VTEGQTADRLAASATQIVTAEAFKWGKSQKEVYFDPAEQDMESQWKGMISPILSNHPIDYSHTVDFACGHGRNAAKLADLAARMTLVDVEKDNIEFCQQRFRGRPFDFVVNSGFDIRQIIDQDVSFFYSFDAMVHFDFEIMLLYVKEFKRILKVGGHGFVHHSNFTGAPGQNFTENPHWRNYMSKELFFHMCVRNGLRVEEQRVIDWGNDSSLDCLTVFRNVN
jgi:SAM-dependent methyltransferase